MKDGTRTRTRAFTELGANRYTTDTIDTGGPVGYRSPSMALQVPFLAHRASPLFLVESGGIEPHATGEQIYSLP